MFLTGLDECSHKDKIGYKVEMSDIYQESMAFKIIPQYNTRKEGDYVQFEDHVYFYLLDSVGESMGKPAFLSFSPAKNSKPTRVIMPDGQDVYRVKQEIKDPHADEHGCYLSKDYYKTAWKIRPFRRQPTKINH
jgi:hypothetical protein